MSEHTQEERIDGDLLEREAEAVVEIFNDAAADYSPELEWFAMDHDRETGRQQFVLEARKYFDRDGLKELREHGRAVEYIESYEYNGEVKITISVPVEGEIPGSQKA